MVRPPIFLAYSPIPPLLQRDIGASTGFLGGFEEASGEQSVGCGEETGYAFGAVEAVCPGGGGDYGVVFRGCG